MANKGGFQFIIDGVVLTPHQLDVINPVLVASFNNRRMSKKALSMACKQALNDAGCPLHSVNQPNPTEEP